VDHQLKLAAIDKTNNSIFLEVLTERGEMMKNKFGINAVTLITATLLFISAVSIVYGQTAKVRPYKVSPGFEKVQNFTHLNRALPIDKKKRALLVKNLFAVSPTKSKQLFHIYEENDYKDIPSFVTTDSVLHLYHIFFDFTLRSVEEKKLTPVLKRLTEGMLSDSVKTWNKADDKQLKQAALKNVVYFSVAARNLGLSPKVPAEAKGMIETEMNLIAGHEGRKVGAIFPYEIDYSKFVPRGHYKSSETLQKFFRTMMWYGNIHVPHHRSKELLKCFASCVMAARNKL
jgi:hypothetical protein